MSSHNVTREELWAAMSEDVRSFVLALTKPFEVTENVEVTSNDRPKPYLIEKIVKKRITFKSISYQKIGDDNELIYEKQLT